MTSPCPPRRELIHHPDTANEHKSRNRGANETHTQCADPPRSHDLFNFSLVATVDAITAPVDAAVAPAVMAVKAPANILVMGDSYSAGNGAGSYVPGTPKNCYRSSKNYAQVFAATIQKAPYNQPATVTNVACSGAVTADVITQNQYPNVPKQINFVTSTFDTIFLTIGGNDAKFGDIVKYCLIAIYRDGANCNPLLTNAENLLANGTISTQVTNVLKAIRAKDVGAKIVLLGYPFLEGDTTYTLRSGHGNNSPIIQVGKRLHALQVKADAIQQSIVKSLNNTNAGTPFAFVSVQKLFAPDPPGIYRGLYAKKNNPNRWMVQAGVDVPDIPCSTCYHPNTIGWSKEGALLASTASVPKTTKPVIATSHLPGGTVGLRYSTQLTTNDHRAGTWTIASGRLPAGLTLSGYTISGTPTTAGTVSFALLFTDPATGETAQLTVSLAIAEATVPTVSATPDTVYAWNPSCNFTPPYPTGFNWTVADFAPNQGLSGQLGSLGWIGDNPTTDATGSFTTPTPYDIGEFLSGIYNFRVTGNNVFDYATTPINVGYTYCYWPTSDATVTFNPWAGSGWPTSSVTLTLTGKTTVSAVASNDETGSFLGESLSVECPATGSVSFSFADANNLFGSSGSVQCTPGAAKSPATTQSRTAAEIGIAGRGEVPAAR